MKNKISFVYFGTSTFSVQVLNTLFENGFIPKTIVTFPDRQQGRQLKLKPNPVKVWGREKGVSVIENFIDIPDADVYVVASYGKILPKEVIYKPKHGTLNVHPSLLPLFRGPSPIQGAIIDGDSVGVTIMRLNEKMDEGPIVAQKIVSIPEWPLGYKESEEILSKAGARLLAEVLPKWVNGTINEKEQDHAKATYTKMIKKEMADITNDSPTRALRKVMAYEVWPRARMGELIITEAHIEDGQLMLDKVIPPGKKEMAYADYLRGRRK